MEGKLNDILRAIKGKGKRKSDGIDEKDEVKQGVEARPRPVRGAHGKCEPVSVRYAYLDAKVRDQAIAGCLPPESLPLLIDPLSPLARPGAQDITVPSRWIYDPVSGFQPVAPSEGEKLATFISAIPSPTHFMYAWSILVDLMIRGMPDEAAEVCAALHWYSRWIADKSSTHTWESICEYHLHVTAKRFVGIFHVSRCYGVVDVDALTNLVQLSRPTPAVGGPSTSKKRKPPKRPNRGNVTCASQAAW